MKFSIGRAKNEAFELIFGDSLIAFAGVGVGLILSIPSMYPLLSLCIVGFVFGFIFDVRALRKFQYDLKNMKKDIDSARTELSNLINESRQMRGQLDHARNDLSNLVNTSQRITRNLEQAQRTLANIKQDFEITKDKVFGHGMSRTSWANPLERMVQELQRKVEQLQRQLDNLQRGMDRRF